MERSVPNDRGSRVSQNVMLGVPERQRQAAVSGTPAEHRRNAALGVVGVAGFVLLVVTWTHLVLIWIPSSFGTPPWEYATATQSVDIFPLGVMGITLLAAALIMRARKGLATALSVWSFLSAIALLAFAALIALNLPIAWRSVAERVREGVIKTGGKAFFFALLFAGYHAWLGVRLLTVRRAPVSGIVKDAAPAETR